MRAHMDTYLRMRRAMGYKLLESEKILNGYITYLEDLGVDVISVDHAVTWATQPHHATLTWHAQRLAVVRIFARWLRSLDARTEVPPADLLPRRKRRPIPYLFSDADVRALLRATSMLRSELSRRTYHTLIGLLAVTGLRRGEAIGLEREDFSARDHTLLVRDTKFGKTRWVPLHPSTSDALQAYLSDRDRLKPHGNARALLVGSTGNQLEGGTVSWTFRRLAQRASLQPRAGSHPPRLHGLRHTLAVRTLLDAYRCGRDPQTTLPLLATYLGHTDPGSTYWYLSATPELLTIAAERLEAHAAPPA